jgi:hypothetical protein
VCVRQAPLELAALIDGRLQPVRRVGCSLEITSP